MNLYLISESNAVLQHWRAALDTLFPIIVSSMRDVPQDEKAIVFILESSFLVEKYAGYPLLRVMVLSMVPEFEKAQTFLQNGAMGYGNAMMHETHLQSAYQTLEEGKVWLYPDFITLLITQIQERKVHDETASHRLDILSPREREVALLLNEGKSHLEISEELQITVRTIKAHSAAIYEKMGVKDRLSLSLLLHS